MRWGWLAAALVAAGCFSEAPSSSGCIDGEAACDCRPDDTCDQGLDCVASIDKCVPTGCTPGSASCTCVDGDCLTGLACEGGVCVTPSAATTGGGASMSSTTSSDTLAETTMGPGTTPVTMTDPLTSDPTIPPLDTGETDPTGMSGSLSTDPTVAEGTDSDTGPSVCPECIDLAGNLGCNLESNACSSDDAAGGCADLMVCILQGGTPDACCPGTEMKSLGLWSALVACAQDNACLDGCGLYCP